MKAIRNMTAKQIQAEIDLLNNENFRKIKSRVSSLQAELRARETTNMILDKESKE